MYLDSLFLNFNMNRLTLSCSGAFLTGRKYSRKRVKVTVTGFGSTRKQRFNSEPENKFPKVLQEGSLQIQTDNE